MEKMACSRHFLYLLPCSAFAQKLLSALLTFPHIDFSVFLLLETKTLFHPAVELQQLLSYLCRLKLCLQTGLCEWVASTPINIFKRHLKIESFIKGLADR